MNTWNSFRSLRRLLAAALGLTLAASPSAFAAASGASPDGIYQLQAQPLSVRGQTPVLTNVIRFQPFTADIRRIQAILARATPEDPNLIPGTPALRQRVELSLPTPYEGKFARFEVEEVNIMHPALAAKYPEIKTYRGRGLDDPSASLALDVTPAGMHAQIRTSAGTIYIDPYYFGNDRAYASYYKIDTFRDPKREGFLCETPGQESRFVSNRIPATSSGTQLRTYRLACAANSTFTNFTGNTVATGLAAVVVVVNRVSAVYEAEVGVRLQLIPNNDEIIYPTTGNPVNGADPYSNTTAALGQNQTNLDAKIGSANYDIGHVFTTGSGGVAGLGVVCRASQKARGTTGLGNPIGDAFNIDFVAHEMGHQFGANHTFNGNTTNCGSNRSSAHAYEPGSGSSIMGYAGVCGANDNLSPNSDAYFLFDSLDAIVNYTTTGLGNCPTPVATGNTIPSVSAGSNFTIPSRTPFALTGSGSDADGDLLSYCWEERDLGVAQAGNTADNGTSPIFRSFYPTYTPTRIFPKASNLVAGIFTNTAAPHGETLPVTNRTLNFRLTVRDNRRNGGAINTADNIVTVVENGAGFAVTAPAGGTFANGSSVATTWNVTGTNTLPVNTANVKISLSTDGGYTYPYVLAASTPNDGAETVALPAGVTSSTARVKVEAVGNIFFSISAANFAIN
ncbi:MAG TPA: zinc-dependent metalloprotease family protein [Chthoniobacterales bacterium]|nr:zinc-dependent metalloprotease family protein [Chthoniobacterales bacterium]